MAFDAIELSEMMALGTLPEAGGVLDQSAKAIAAHRMIRGDIASIEREELEKARGRS